MTKISTRTRYAIYAMVATGLIASVVLGYYFVFRYPIWTLRAFAVPSASMCPTICENERIIAQIDPDQQFEPVRNDVIVMDHDEITKFIKGVVGLPGDTISPGPKNEILINGKLLQPAPICGTPGINPGMDPHAPNDIRFVQVKVPEGSYFVIGDNLNNSLDSRTQEFGLIPLHQMRGKGLMIYYSPKPSRIGCPVR